MAFGENADQLMGKLQEVLDTAYGWLDEISDLHGAHGRTYALAAEVERDLQTIEQLRSRATSSLLTLAFLGEFSSGKSFLISGLQRQLSLEKLRIGGKLVDKYVGLLPATPKPTSSCPARVIPVAVSSSESRGPSLRVRFTDASGWEDKGVIDRPLAVAAYATELSEYVVNRTPADRQRQVAEIEIVVPDHVLPAQLYDLPGINAPSRVHDAIVQERMEDADCFVYVARATDTLSESALELIRFLYQHHKTTGKRVIWVVTAIDLASDLGLDDEPKWKGVVDQNSAYLGESFVTEDGHPDLAFIGQGFIGVSPALEAQGVSMQAEDRHSAAELEAESRMPELRRLLNGIIESETGPKRADAVAREAQVLVQRHQTALQAVLATERIPVDDLKGELDAVASRIRSFDQDAEGVKARLSEDLRRRVAEAVQALDEAGLAGHLHEALDTRIRTTDLRKDRAVNEVEVHKTQVVWEWLSRDGGALETWEREFDTFKEGALEALRHLLGEAALPGGGDQGRGLTMDRLSLPEFHRTDEESEDLISKASQLAGTIAPLAGTVVAGLSSTPWATAVLGAAAVPTLLPVGAAVAAAGLYGLRRHRLRVKSVLDVMRREAIDSLDKVPTDSKDWLVFQASLLGQKVIRHADEVIDDHRLQLLGSLRRLDERSREPEAIGQQDFVARLNASCAAAADVETRLSACRL